MLQIEVLEELSYFFPKKKMFWLNQVHEIPLTQAISLLSLLHKYTCYKIANGSWI